MRQIKGVAMRPQTIASLQAAGIGANPISYRRRVVVRASNPKDDRIVPVLDFSTPLGHDEPNTAQLSDFLWHCKPLLAGVERATTIQVGGFASTDAVRCAELREGMLQQLLEATERFASNVAGEMAAENSKLSIVLPGDEPVQQLQFATWFDFYMFTRTESGGLSLRVEYPEYHRFGKRPIDDIDSFLAVLATWFQARCREHRMELMDNVKKFKHDLPDDEVPDYLRKVRYSGGQSFDPMFGYGFDWSGLELVAYTDLPPAPSEIRKVLRYFRDQLAANVPALSAQA